MVNPKRKIKVTIAWKTDRSYLAKFSDRLVIRYTITKTRLVRIVAVYFSAPIMRDAIVLSQRLTELFSARGEIREPRYVSGAHEVVIRSPKVGVMAAIERFCSALLTPNNVVAIPSALPARVKAQLRHVGGTVTHRGVSIA